MTLRELYLVNATWDKDTKLYITIGIEWVYEDIAYSDIPNTYKSEDYRVSWFHDNVVCIARREES